MADAADSKSATRKGVKVRLLSPAPHSKGLTGFVQKRRQRTLHLPKRVHSGLQTGRREMSVALRN